MLLLFVYFVCLLSLSLLLRIDIFRTSTAFLPLTVRSFKGKLWVHFEAVRKRKDRGGRGRGRGKTGEEEGRQEREGRGRGKAGEEEGRQEREGERKRKDRRGSGRGR